MRCFLFLTPESYGATNKMGKEITIPHCSWISSKGNWALVHWFGEFARVASFLGQEGLWGQVFLGDLREAQAGSWLFPACLWAVCPGAAVGGLGNNTAVEVVKTPSLLHKKASASQGSLWKRSPEFLGTVNRRWAVTRWGFAKFIYVIITCLVLAFRFFLHRDPSEPGKVRGQPGSFLEWRSMKLTCHWKESELQPRSARVKHRWSHYSGNIHRGYSRVENKHHTHAHPFIYVEYVVSLYVLNIN